MEKVCVVLSAYNGEKYLSEQIESILKQKYVDIILSIRDDGSKDKTDSIIRKWAAEYSNIKIIEDGYGVNLGVAKSFSYLLNRSAELFSEVNYFFFADQDDYWLDNKCSRAVERLEKYKNDKAMYFSKKRIVSVNLESLKSEDIVNFHNSVWSFFDRSNVYGCTMCMTRSLIEYIYNDKYYDSNFLHDAYIYRLCLSTDIPIIYDDEETILYRQHGNNVVGAVKRNVFNGIKKIFNRNRFHVIREMSQYIVSEHSDIVSQTNKGIFNLLSDYEHSIKSKHKLIKLYSKQKDRKIKEKIIFSFSVMLNYF